MLVYQRVSFSGIWNVFFSQFHNELVLNEPEKVRDWRFMVVNKLPELEGKSSGDFLVDVPLNQSVDHPSTICF